MGRIQAQQRQPAAGENISALANSAALEGKPFAYVVWGVRDEDHLIEGTSFDPRNVCIVEPAVSPPCVRLKVPKAMHRGSMD